MSDAHLIDPFEFARLRAEGQWRLPVARFERLHEHLAADQGELNVGLRGDVSKHGKPMLSLSVDGELNLVCQRCLEPLQHAVELRAQLVLARQDTAVEEEIDPEAPDILVADAALDVADLAEQELVLSLPITLSHTDCHPPTLPTAAVDVRDEWRQRLAQLRDN